MSDAAATSSTTAKTASPADPVSVAVVGLGWWGRTLARIIAGSGKLQLHTVVDVDAAAADWAREENLRFRSDLADVLADPEIEAVILCTPHSMHHGQIVSAARAGKHVLCEKPLALTGSHAAEAVAACRSAGVVLGIGHERRFEPPILELRRRVASGDLGTLLQIEATFSQDKFLGLAADNWRLSGREAPGGPMTATGIHLVDLAVSFLGPAERAAATVSQLGSQLVNGDTLGALVTFRSGAVALIGACLATPFAGRFALYGNRGWVEIVDKAHPESSEGWAMTTCLRGGERQRVDYPPASGVAANLDCFADAVRGQQRYPVSDRELVGTITTMEAIVSSAANGGRAEPVRHGDEHHGTGNC